MGVYRGESDTPHFLAVLQAPTFFGEMVLQDPERIRTASVKALTARGASVSVARQAGAGKTPHSGSAERPKRAARPLQRGPDDLRLTRRGRKGRYLDVREAQNGISNFFSSV